MHIKTIKQHVKMGGSMIKNPLCLMLICKNLLPKDKMKFYNLKKSAKMDNKFVFKEL
jgi:hypothetical protein